jgi:hypothetical protein
MSALLFSPVFPEQHPDCINLHIPEAKEEELSPNAKPAREQQFIFYREYFERIKERDRVIAELEKQREMHRRQQMAIDAALAPGAEKDEGECGEKKVAPDVKTAASDESKELGVPGNEQYQAGRGELEGQSGGTKAEPGAKSAANDKSPESGLPRNDQGQEDVVGGQSDPGVKEKTGSDIIPDDGTNAKNSLDKISFPLFLDPTFDIFVGSNGVRKEILIPISFTHISSILYAMESKCPREFESHLLEVYDPPIFTAYMDFWRAYSTQEPIRDIACRTVFVVGKDDPWATEESVNKIMQTSVLKVRDRLGDIVPKCASLKVCDNCGHIPMLTNLERVMEIVLKFLPAK